MRTAFKQLMIALILMTCDIRSNSDEGMWLYNDPPRRLLKEKYGFELTEVWLEHLQKSSVRSIAAARAPLCPTTASLLRTTT